MIDQSKFHRAMIQIDQMPESIVRLVLAGWISRYLSDKEINEDRSFYKYITPEEVYNLLVNDIPIKDEVVIERMNNDHN